MRLTGIALVLASAVAVQFAGMAQAADPTPPAAIQKCYDNAMGDFDLVECINAETEFWDKLLNDNYKKAMRGCTSFAQGYFTGAEVKDVEAKCKKQLKDTQRTWIKFRDGMSGIQCEYSFNYGGTLQRVECASAYNELVKEQALRLGRLYGVDE